MCTEFIARALYEKGKVFEDFGESKESKKAFEASIERFTILLSSSNKNSTLYNEWLCCRGFVSLKSKNLDKAEKDFRDVLETDPSDIKALKGKALRGLASIYLQKKDYDKAFKEIDTAIDYIEKEEIKDPKPYKTKGNIFYSKEAYYEALEWYKKSLDIDPKYVDAWINKAAVLIKLEEYSKAIKAIENALYLDELEKIGWHNKGVIFSQVGQYDRSLEARNEAIKLDPSNPDFLLGRAAVYNKLEYYNFSLDDLDKASQFAPKDAEIWSFKSRVFHNLQRYSDSLDSCENALKFNPNDDKIWNFKGFILYKLEKHSEALKAFEKALEKNKQNYRPYMNLGILYKEKFKNFKKAELYFEKTITILLKEIFPKDGIVISENAFILGKLEKYGHILEQKIFAEDILLTKKNTSNFYKIKKNISEIVKTNYFEKPLNKILDTPDRDLLLIKRDIETGNKYSLKWNNISFILRELGKYKQARKAAEKAISIDPENYEAWNCKGLSLKELGEYDEAVESFERSLNLCPEYIESHINKWTTLRKQQLYTDESFKDLKEILDANLLKNKKAPDTWYHKGLVFYELDECKTAIKAFDEVIKINPTSIDAWNHKGLAFYKLARYTEALQAFDKAIDFFPDKKNSDAFNNKGLVLTDLNNFEESEKSFKKAIEIDEKNFEAYNNLGRLYLSQEKIGEAHKHFSKAIELKKDSHEVLVNKGLLFIYTALYENSIDAFNKALSLRPVSATCYLCNGIASLNSSRYEDTKTNLKKAIGILGKQLNSNFDERFRITRFQINSVLSHLALGKLYFNTGSTKSASMKIIEARYFADKSQDLPENLKGLLNYLEGKLKIEYFDYKKAIELFQKAIYEDPSERKYVLWHAYSRYLSTEFSNNLKKEYQQEIVSIIRGLESTLSVSDGPMHETFIYKLKVKVNDFLFKIQEAFPLFYSKLPISAQMCFLECLHKRKKRKEELLLRANTHYFLGCFYYKINDFFSSKDQFEKCYKLKPGDKLQKSSRDFLEIIMKYQIKPSWWHWWLYSPIDRLRKKIVFFVLVTFVFVLTLLHPLIYPIIFRFFSNFTDVSLNVTSYGLASSENFSSIDWTLYFVTVIICILILLYPSIEYIRSKDIEIKFQSTQPLVEFYFPLCTPIFSMMPSLGLEESKKCPSLNQSHIQEPFRQ